MSSDEMPAAQTDGSRKERARFWWILVRVMLVQAVSLLLLWALEARYAG